MGVLPPESTLSVRIDLGSLDSPNAVPPVTMAMRTGVFRVVLELCESPELESNVCRRLPVEQRQSNTFEVRYVEAANAPH